jgi:FkbM family methyltransferase
MFDRVYTFECEPLLYECLTRNCAEVKNLVRSDCALGADQGMVSMRGHCSAGSWRIEEGGEHKVVQVSIDQLKLKHCDAIFLDIEGYEPQALKGAENTIARCRPIIMVEELPRSRDAIAVTLDNLGYRFAKAVHKDRVYIPKERRA